MRMRSWRLLVAATLVAATFLASEPASWGQDPEPGAGGEIVHSWALTPAGSSDPAAAGNRPHLSFEVDPGGEVTDAVTLFNLGTEQLTFAVYATDAFNNDSGEFDLLPTGEEPTDVGSWVTLPQANLTVPPGTQVTMPITIKVPADATAGDHVGAILAASVATGAGPDGSVVELDRRTGTRMYVRVTGDIRPDLAVESVKTSYHPALNPLGGSATIKYRIQNRGNVRLGGDHRVSIAGPLGIGKRSVAAKPLTELLPGEGVDIEVEVDDVAATAVAFTKVEVDPVAGSDSTAEAGTSDRRTGLALAAPISVILLILVVWLGFRARRAYRRNRLQERGPVQGARAG